MAVSSMPAVRRQRRRRLLAHHLAHLHHPEVLVVEECTTN